LEINRLCMGCMTLKDDDGAQCPVCGFIEGTKPDSPLFLEPRTVLEHKYLIGRVLGQGGFGITYLAWDLNLNIKLAIKEYFPQELASRPAGHNKVSAYAGSMGSQYEYGLDKFLQEARTLAQFEGHPNIVSVRDFFRANDTAYFVMSYVEGITLQQYMTEKGGSLPVDQAFGIIMPVLDALQVVHAAEVLHRDISPDNIYINQRGQVILIDFGAARQAIGEKGRSLSIILKPGYAPEEQYRSKGVQGPWTDIYAVAATTYHLLTGQQPPEALERLSEDGLIPPSRLDVAIGELEEKALLKALAVRGPERYQSVQDFQADLIGEQSAVSFTSPDKTTKTTVQQSVRKNDSNEIKQAVPVKMIAVVVASVVLIAGSVAAYSLIGSTGAADNVAAEEREFTEEPQEETGSIVETESASEEENTTQPEENINENAGSDEESESEPESEPEPEPEPKHEPESEPEPEPELEPEPEPEQTAGQEVQNMSYEGGTYSGDVKNGIPHGQGKWTHPVGLSYTGQFSDGSVTGYGTMHMPSGDVYVGNVLKGKPHGQGKLTKADGTVQEGNWVNGILQ
jgi:serine/threonine protein kinase